MPWHEDRRQASEPTNHLIDTRTSDLLIALFAGAILGALAVLGGIILGAGLSDAGIW
jgi:hypothetical protein